MIKYAIKKMSQFANEFTMSEIVEQPAQKIPWFTIVKIMHQHGAQIPWRTIMTVIIPKYKTLEELPEYLEKKLNEK